MAPNNTRWLIVVVCKRLKSDLEETQTTHIQWMDERWFALCKFYTRGEKMQRLSWSRHMTCKVITFAWLRRKCTLLTLTYKWVSNPTLLSSDETFTLDAGVCCRWQREGTEYLWEEREEEMAMEAWIRARVLKRHRGREDGTEAFCPERQNRRENENVFPGRCD